MYGGEIAVGRRPPTGKSFRFVRVVRAGEAKLRGRARNEPAAARAKSRQLIIPLPPVWRWLAMSRGVPWCP
eukprot:4806267-Pyramimonas_sp.AAC.1